MKKLLAILMTVLLLMSLSAVAEESSENYGLYVGGVEVTPENKGDVLGDGTVSYDSGINYLYLKDAAIAGASGIPGDDGVNALASIWSKGDLTIKVRNKCVIGYFGNPQADDAWYGIRCDGNLTISGTSAQESTLMVAVCGADSTVRTADACGLFCAGNLDVDSCLVQSGCEAAAEGFENTIQHGVCCKGLLKITGAILVGYTSEQTLVDGTVGVEIRALEYERAAIIGMSGNSGFTFGGMMTQTEYDNLAYQQMFSPLHVVSGDNYDGTGTKLDYLNNFLTGSHTAKYVAMQPAS